MLREFGIQSNQTHTLMKISFLSLFFSLLLQFQWSLFFLLSHFLFFFCAQIDSKWQFILSISDVNVWELLTFNIFTLPRILSHSLFHSLTLSSFHTFFRSLHIEAHTHLGCVFQHTESSPFASDSMLHIHRIIALCAYILSLSLAFMLRVVSLSLRILTSV